jgi:hypothetical protein
MVIPKGRSGFVVGLLGDRIVERHRLDPTLVWEFRRPLAGWGWDVKWKDKTHARICPLCRKAELAPRKRLCEQCRIYKRNLTFHRSDLKRQRVKPLYPTPDARQLHAILSLAE